MLLGFRGDCHQRNQDDVASGHFYLEFFLSERCQFFLPFFSVLDFRKPLSRRQPVHLRALPKICSVYRAPGHLLFLRWGVEVDMPDSSKLATAMSYRNGSIGDVIQVTYMPAAFYMQRHFTSPFPFDRTSLRNSLCAHCSTFCCRRKNCR